MELSSSGLGGIGLGQSLGGTGVAGGGSTPPPSGGGFSNGFSSGFDI